MGNMYNMGPGAKRMYNMGPGAKRIWENVGEFHMLKESSLGKMCCGHRLLFIYM